MILCDVNVLVSAFREDMGDHQAYYGWLTDRLEGDEPVGLSGLVNSAFLRIVTNPRIFERPSSLDRALAFVDDLRQSPVTVPISEGPRHWAIFERLCRKIGATGNRIPDAYLAALAVESGCELVTADRGFGRFPELRWRHPMDG